MTPVFHQGSGTEPHVSGRLAVLPPLYIGLIAGFGVRLLVEGRWDRAGDPSSRGDAFNARFEGGTVSEVDVRHAPPVLAEEWDALVALEGYRIEIVQGELVVSPGVALRHGRAQTELTVLLRAAMPDAFRAVFGVEWRFDVHGVVAMA